MIDDDNDKVRRNLVVASSIVITFAWLGVGEIVLIQKLIGHEVALLNWKVSVLFIAILTYLSLRYRFADSTIREYGRLIGEWNAIVANNVDKRIHQLFRIFTKTPQDTVLFSPKLSDYVNSQIADTAFGEKKDWHLVSLQHTSIQPKDMWSGELNMAIELMSADGYTSSRTGGNNIEYSFTGFERYRVLVISLIRLMTYTKGAIDFIAPISLTTFAFIILIFRLVRDSGIC